MRTRSPLTVLLLGAIVAGCGSEPPTAPADADASAARASASSPAPALRPMSGHCETRFNPPPFPPPAIHRQTDVGTCQLAHLGRTALHGVQDINFAAGTQSGERTFTAANGDELHARHAGTSAMVAPGRIAFSAVVTIVGGTGRFEGATGELRVIGVAVLAETRATMTIDEGWIAY